MTAVNFSLEIEKQKKSLQDFALKLTRDYVEASDLIQETNYRAIKNYHKFEENSNLRGWLMTIMRNIFINNYRKKRVRQTYQDWSKNGYLINTNADSAPNQGAVDVEYEELFAMIERLDDYLKTPFLMHYNGYKYDEIAAEVGAPLGTIKSRIHTARKRLQTMIKRQYAMPFEINEN